MVESGINMEILADIKRQAGNIVPFDKSEIFLSDNKSGFFSLSNRYASPFGSAFKIFMEDGIVDWIVEKDQPVFVEDLDSITNNSSTNNYLILPFKVQHKNLLMLLYTQQSESELSHSDMKKLRKLINSLK